jgi:hypothetical protein
MQNLIQEKCCEYDPLFKCEIFDSEKYKWDAIQTKEHRIVFIDDKNIETEEDCRVMIKKLEFLLEANKERLKTVNRIMVFISSNPFYRCYFRMISKDFVEICYS